jgi:hypothetical protein
MVLLLATGAVVGGLAWFLVIDLIVEAAVLLLAVLLLARLSVPF